MHTLFTVSLVCGWLLLSGQSLAQAQEAARTQPILLSESACCASPARIPTASPPHEYRGTSYLTPSMAESMPTVMYAPVAASSTPFAPSRRRSPAPVRSAPVVEYRFYASLRDRRHHSDVAIRAGHVTTSRLRRGT